MRNIYCISGLGADERIFQKLRIRNSNMIFLGWPEYDEGDTMSSYAVKLSQLITEENPILLGVSFGGMLTVEIAKQRVIKKGIIVSSTKRTDEKPKLPGLIKWVAT
ncbi:MAG: alpha/beta hydrolase, partial [Chitinophagaceae bacterium]|nr:alpha/beta hydrolase [Chitinophagaceae bacterium]